MRQTYYINAFGVNGTITPPVPMATDPTGLVSFSEGWTFDYQRDLDTDSLAKSPTYINWNYVEFVATTSIKQYQENGIPEFILASQTTAGTAFPYAEGAMVLYSASGAPPFTPYMSLVDNNTDTPPSANWVNMLSVLTTPYVFSGGFVQGSPNQIGPHMISLGWNGTTSKIVPKVDATIMSNVALEAWVTSNFLDLNTGGIVTGPVTVDGTFINNGNTTVEGAVNVSGNVGVVGGISANGNINSATLLESENGVNTSGAILVSSSFGNTNPFATATSGLVVETNGQINSFGVFHAFGNAGGPFIGFGLNGNNSVGSIANNGAGGTAFNTTSDERLKENLVPVTGALDRVLNTPVYSGNYKAHPGMTKPMFLAHEAQIHHSHSVTGTRDETKTHTNAVLAPNGCVIADGVSEADFNAELIKPTLLTKTNVVLLAGIVIAEGVTQAAFAASMESKRPAFPVSATWAASVTTKLPGSRYPVGSTWVASVTVEVHMQMDHASMMPDAFAAIQELNAKLTAQVAALTARIEALTPKA